MDRKELENKLNSDFKLGCSIKGYPIDDICLEEAYAGDIATSFIVNVVASWVKDMDCSAALDVLIDVLWETTEFQHRAAIFSINVFADEKTLHCQSIEHINAYKLETNAKV